MKIIQDHFQADFEKNHFPRWKCPNSDCREGHLTIDLKTAREEENAATQRDWREEWFEPADHALSRYSAILRCVDCKEPVIVVGRLRWAQYHDQETGETIQFEYVHPTFFEPPLKILPISQDWPDDVVDALSSAFSVFWTSPGAAGNAIRIAAERLLTHHGVPTHEGERLLFLNARLALYKQQNPPAHQLLDGIRWLGNSASHGDEVGRTDVLDGLEVFGQALESLYPQRAIWAEKRAQQFIDQKGVRPRGSSGNAG